MLVSFAPRHLKLLIIYWSNALFPGICGSISFTGWVGGTLSPNVNDRELIGWWKAVRKRLQKADRLCFDSVVVLISWFLWKERNNRTFDRVSNSVPQLLSLLLDELIAWF